MRADLAHFEQHKLTIASKVDLPGPVSMERPVQAGCVTPWSFPVVFEQYRPGGRTSRGEDD